MKSIIPGDLNFTYNPHSPLSQAIASNTHAKISHVQCVLDVGISGTLYVMSAEVSGMTPEWVIPEAQDWQTTLTCPKLSLRDRDNICKWMWDHKDVDYDIWGLASFLLNIDVNTEAKVFCSEACFLGYQEAAGIWLLDGVDHAFVSPRDLWISPLLVTRDGSPKEVR
jgi:hypothetical protein